MKRYISNLNVEITTDLGTFETIEVTSENLDGTGYKTYDYFAPEIGLLKTVFEMEDSNITSSLVKLDNNKTFNQIIRFYYPDGSADKIFYVDRQIEFSTNEETKNVFETEFKTIPPEISGNLLSDNTNILSISLINDNKVAIDFSKEFVSEMNAGSGYESMILQSIVNTIGQYYNVERVYISLEGEPYSSGHILIKNDEYFTVDTTNCVSLD